MISADYKYEILENFKIQGNNYQIQYDTILNHIKEFYEIKCKAISHIKYIKDFLIKSNVDNLSYKDIIYKIDSSCILFKVENDNFNMDNDISPEPKTALAIRTSLDTKSLRDVPSIPANCVALAYLLEKQNLGKSKKKATAFIPNIYILGGKLIGKLILGSLGLASLVISGLGILNKAAKNDAKTMELFYEINTISNRLRYQTKSLEKIDLKICCLRDELYHSIELLKNFNSSTGNINPEIFNGISSICDILEEKI